MKKNLKFMKYATFCVISIFMTSLAFTGCKNHDEDIKRLDSEIAALKASLSASTTALDAVKSDLAAAKTDLQTQITAAKNAAAAAQTAADAAGVAAAEAKAAAAQAKLDAIAEAEKLVAALKTELIALITANQDDIDDLKQAVADLENDIATVVGRLDALDIALANLETELNALGLTVADLEQWVNNNKAFVAKNKAYIDLQIAILEQYGYINAEGAADFAAVLEDLKASQAAVAGLEILVNTLYDLLDASGIDVNGIKGEITSLKDAVAVVEGIANANGIAIADLQAAVGTMQTDIADIKAVLAGIDMTALQALIAAHQSILSLGATVSDMITNISAAYQEDAGPGDATYTKHWIQFNSTKAVVNYVFGAGMPGATTFVAGQALQGSVDNTFVKVNPLNSVLNADKLFFMNSQGNTAINDFLEISVAKWNGLIVKAPESGIWEVTVTLKEGVDEAAFLALTRIDLGPNAHPRYEFVQFALVVDNQIEASNERYVSTEYIYDFDVWATLPVYNWQDAPNDLTFTVGGTAHTNIRNRYNTAEDGSPTPARDKMWGNATGTYNTAANPTADDPADNRNAQPIKVVTTNKAFELDLPNDRIFKYYVTLDRANAVESAPSELNAWNSYTYEGLDIVKDQGDPVAIKVVSPNAVGDIIGFRVFAVNYDGTLVDPDGKAFYVMVLPEISSSALNFTVTADTYLNFNTEIISRILPTGVVAANITSYTLDLTLENNATVTTVGHYLANGNAGTGWANPQITLEGIDAMDLLDNGKVYSGTLTLERTSNGQQIPYGIVNVTVTKVLPTFDGVVEYKTGFPTTNGIIHAYPMLDGIMGDFNMASAFNGLALGMNFAFTGQATGRGAVTFAYEAVGVGGTESWTAIVPDTEIGVADLLLDPGTIRTTPTVYSASLFREYPNFAYWNGVGANAPYRATWAATPPIKVEFRSFVQDFTLTWNTAPTLYYNYPNGTTNASVIRVQPIVGGAFNLSFAAPATYTGPNSEIREYTVVGLTALTGDGFTRENEYFTPTFSVADNWINWNETPNVGAPATDIDHMLKVRIQDEFGKEYEFIIPGTFKMMKQHP